MKILPDHYQQLEKAILTYADKYGGLEYLKKEYDKDGLSPMRLRWDLMFGANLPSADLPLYDYLDDSHIDTALRRITRTAN
jgi:hypothetical protein